MSRFTNVVEKYPDVGFHHKALTYLANCEAWLKSGKVTDNVGLIRKKISQAMTSLQRSDLDNAKKIYIGIMKTYMSLSPKEQAEIYNDIKKLYIERKSKEKAMAG